MANSHNDSTQAPSWLVITAFALMVVILFVFGDPLVGTLGTILIGVTFANYYTGLSQEGH